MKVMKFAAVLLLAVGMFSTTAIANNPGDDCATAVPAPGGLDPCLDKNPTGPLGGCTSFGSLYDVWVSFVAPSTSARVRTDLSSAGTDSDYIVWDACGGNRIGCSEDDGTAPGSGCCLGNICVGGLTVGNTYYVQLGAWAAGQDLSGFGLPNPYLYSCGVYNIDIEAAGTCGDSVVDCGEQCDPPGPCCSATCQNVIICGNGCIEGTEDCEGPGDPVCPGGAICQADCTCPPIICGNNLVEAGEECDGTGTPLCPEGSQCNRLCRCYTGIPAVSEWGLAVLTLIGLVSGTILFGRRRVAAH
jgi:hypothetical protein